MQRRWRRCCQNLLNQRNQQRLASIRVVHVLAFWCADLYLPLPNPRLAEAERFHLVRVMFNLLIILIIYVQFALICCLRRFEVIRGQRKGSMLLVEIDAKFTDPRTGCG